MEDANSDSSDTWSIYSQTTAPEECNSADHNAQYWVANGWNVIFTDWSYFATLRKVNQAEDQMYSSTSGIYSIVDAICILLGKLLQELQWEGKELRLVGHSLGGQFTLNLAAKIKNKAYQMGVLYKDYRDKLTRIALLDPFFSRQQKKGLPRIGDTKQRYTPGQWAVLHNLPLLTDVVIEHYKTTPLLQMMGDKSQWMDQLNAHTVFVEMAPNYYPSGPNLLKALGAKHNAAFANYLHAMKFNKVKNSQSLRLKSPILRGSPIKLGYNDLIPSCTMSTETLKKLCPSIKTRMCAHFVQVTDDEFSANAARTTWDYDDVYERIGGHPMMKFSALDNLDGDNYLNDNDNLIQRFMRLLGYIKP